MRTLLFCSLAIVLFAAPAFAAPRPNAWMIPDNPLNPTETDSGGPDPWGYTWKQSGEPGGPVVAWKDITAVGTLVTGLGDDNNVGPFPIGFTFHYYWYDVTQYWIGSNGYLEFGPPYIATQTFPNTIPLVTAPNNFLAPFMADLDLALGGQCFRWNNGDSCVISWLNVPAWNTGGAHTFQVVLSRLDSNLTFQYGSQQGTVSNNDILIGIEDVSGTMGLMYSHDAYPPPHNAIKWYHPTTPTAVVHDVAATAAGNAASEGFFMLPGETLNPTGIVKNVGNVSESGFQVNCTLQLLGSSIVYNQTQTIATPLAPNTETTVTFSPTWTATANGTYFFKITATVAGDLNPNNNLKTTEMHVITLPGTLVYDDGTAETGWVWQRDNDILANHFIPPVYPATIDSVEYYVVNAWWISNPHPFIAQILDDDGPNRSPGSILFSQVINTPTYNQWYRAATNVIIEEGGFYVGWQLQDSLTLPLGLDHTTTQPFSRQGWEYTNTWSHWSELEYGDLMIRASIHTIPAPALDVILIPLNPPIIIPANGGSFNFNVSLVRNVGPQAPYTVWARIKNPDGSYTPPTLGPVTINTPVGTTITCQRSQSIPGSWPPGVYQYLGYVNMTYSYPAYDSSMFIFTKSTAGDGGATIWEASCTGEPFPGERSMTALVPSGLNLKMLPNPFNAVTAISYELGAASYVSLKVYDTTGRLVTTLLDGWREAGLHQVTFDGSKLASGLYLVRMQSGEYAAVKKLVLLK
jgi:hypothetical protein